ncbi:DUF1761 domain-containing protein [Sphingomonas sp.]|uniref:DUF1761 domain-containing protein n=1 Tax=Sphingomonas sp. TaxID=28214 RepID=UPI0031DB366A
MGTEIHWLAVLAAAVAGFAVGALWYGPLFGRAWMAERGITREDAAKANMPLVFGMAFALNLIASFVLDHVLGTYGAPDLGLSVMIAGGIALGFIVTSIGVNYLFSRMSMRLFLIDAGYWVVVYCVMGVVLQLLR